MEPGAAVEALYVHAPFCARRCVYCDFAVAVRATGDLAAWGVALAQELEWLRRSEGYGLAPRLATLYVGGGTPSLLGPAAMASLAELLGEERLSRSDLEWTAEANPESFTPDLAGAWRSAGVNRVSLGVQTFHEPALRWMGRLHGPEGAERARRVAADVGIENVSLDLIFGLPRATGRSWSHDLERVLQLGVPHVSLYGLTVEAGTPLGRAVAEGREAAVDEGQYREEFLEAAERLTAAGFEHYEVSNFAVPGRASRHNATYWDGSPYLGLGNGAHRYQHPVRRWNVRDWEAYRERLAAGRSPEEGRETLGSKEVALERRWLGLRTRRGVSLDDLSSAGQEAVQAWAATGLATVDDRVRLTAEGWLELDRLTVELDVAETVAPHADGSDAPPSGPSSRSG